MPDTKIAPRPLPNPLLSLPFSLARYVAPDSIVYGKPAPAVWGFAQMVEEHHRRTGRVLDPTQYRGFCVVCDRLFEKPVDDALGYGDCCSLSCLNKQSTALACHAALQNSPQGEQSEGRHFSES